MDTPTNKTTERESPQPAQQTQRKRTFIIVLLLTTFVFSVFFYTIYKQREQYDNGIGRFKEDQLSFSNLGGDSRLLTQNGEQSLSALWQNKVLLLYFGFTRCPDICPTSLSMMQAALTQLPPREREQLQVIFVSVDPEYDTPEHLQNYVEFFIEDAIGMTATLDTTQAMAKSYGAFFRKVELPESALGYTIDHTTRWYVIQKNGKIGTTFDHNLPPSEIAKILSTFAKDAI